MTVIADALKGLRISPKEIADRSQLGIDRVQQILGGEVAAVSEVRAIAVGLKVPLHLLARLEPPSEAVKFRPLFRDTKKGQAAFDITVEKVASFVDAALAILPPRVELPRWLLDLNATATTYVEADRLAKRFRQITYPNDDTDPAIDLIAVLGAMEGVVVSRLDYSRYEGVSLISGNYCFIFVSPRFAGRMLFTLGHELGHLLAHHQADGRARFEMASDIGAFGRHSRDEAFVDAFSSCLLLPDVGVARALKAFREHYRVVGENLTDIELLLLARFYGVSFAVAARRCEDLGLLPPGVGFALTERLGKNFGSPEKRADELGLPERSPILFPAISSNLAKALTTKIGIGDVSIGWAADRLGVTIGEILASNARAVYR